MHWDLQCVECGAQKFINSGFRVQGDALQTDCTPLSLGFWIQGYALWTEAPIQGYALWTAVPIQGYALWTAAPIQGYALWTAAPIQGYALWTAAPIQGYALWTAALILPSPRDSGFMFSRLSMFTPHYPVVPPCSRPHVHGPAHHRHALTASCRTSAQESAKIRATFWAGQMESGACTAGGPP